MSWERVKHYGLCSELGEQINKLMNLYWTKWVSVHSLRWYGYRKGLGERSQRKLELVVGGVGEFPLACVD